MDEYSAVAGGDIKSRNGGRWSMVDGRSTVKLGKASASYGTF